MSESETNHKREAEFQEDPNSESAAKRTKLAKVEVHDIPSKRDDDCVEIEADAAEDKGSRHSMEDAWVVMLDAFPDSPGKLRCSSFFKFYLYFLALANFFGL